MKALEPRKLFRVGRSLTGAGLVLGLLAGLAAGVGGYTFIYARGASYMTNAPEALRQLSRHGRAVQGLEPLEPPRGSGVQRLPHAGEFLPASI